MLQSFKSVTHPRQGPPRLAALRGVLKAHGLSGYLVPRADMHQGEYVAPRDERLQWLTGFTGSAGFGAVLHDKAGVFVDGRYRVQIKTQVDLEHFTPVAWPETQLGPWLRTHLEAGEIGFDPWLHSVDEIAALEAALRGSELRLTPCANMIDAIWSDQPAPPMGAAFVHPEELAGQSALSKITAIAEGLRASGVQAAALTLPDSLCWLLNIRGADVARTPVLHGTALIYDDGRAALFAHQDKVSPDVRRALEDAQTTLLPQEDFAATLGAFKGNVLLDHASAPYALAQILGARAVLGEDPCRLPKACKNHAEIAATRRAHLRDGAALVRFLHWFEGQDPQGLTEIDVVKRLEGFRRATGKLHDLSFETICGAAENGAIIHYRVTQESNRPLLKAGETSGVLLLDSGAQYVDGTTDITRSLPLGRPSLEMRRAYTLVLKGLIALSRARFPKGVAGAHLDALARYPLWLEGMDYDHGTGHGVGAFLSVHEGPQRISRASNTPLQPGMILSNEPGYYREGAFGIRLENLITVIDAPPCNTTPRNTTPCDTPRAHYAFETLTYAPFSRALILSDGLSADEQTWLNEYHREVESKLVDLLDEPAERAWLRIACAAL